MSVLSRTRLFSRIEVDGGIEYDFLNTNIDNMELSTVNNVYINEAFVGRPDLLSYSVYRNYDFGWLIAWYNDLLDPVGDLTVGKKIKIPSLEDYYRFVNRNRKSR